ncbi:hypothetical protein C0580_03700 [Candidatus Parcubacteria bacterium]|nr:MAG: hypothetical protein C0580_03700 [Candidatus Parcubacteria bacterium]
MIKENKSIKKKEHEEQIENFHYIFYIILSFAILLNFVFVIMGIGRQYYDYILLAASGMIAIVLYILVSKDSKRLKKKKKLKLIK